MRVSDVPVAGTQELQRLEERSLRCRWIADITGVYRFGHDAFKIRLVLINGATFWKSFQAACIEVGLERATGPKVWQYKGLLLHDLRRSGVRNLIRSGVSRRIAMRISGHLTESTF